ncbi:RdRP-domain-containing protein [Amylostereum chailletii]|nr:RdRP-domain-containing protein [Amylostereum chailletii]
MEIDIKYVDFNATKFQVQRAIQEVLHGPDLFDPDDPKTKGRVHNFMVTLNNSPAGGSHNGTGILTLSKRVGENFLAWVRDHKTGIRVLGTKLRFFRSHRKVPLETKQILDNALYIGPDQEEERDEILKRLGIRLRVAKVQFGVWYKSPHAPPGSSRVFSVEYEKDFQDRSAAYIEVVYDHKLMRVELGERMTEELCQNVVLKFSSIRKMAIGFDYGNPYIVFDMLTPPILEEKNFNDRPRDGIQRRRHKDRDRISGLNEAHQRVAPYAPHLRLILFERDDLTEFEHLCNAAKCEPRPLRISSIEASKYDFFSSKAIWTVQRWLKTMSWTNAFQIEALLRNGLLNTDELFTYLRTPIEDVFRRFGDQASDVLRHYSLALNMRSSPTETPRECLERVCEEYENRTPMSMSAGRFNCHHVTFTPTRMLLEGPYATQSNRVIRRYQRADAPELAENFIRVDFREEDRLSYRWDRDVDGTYFLQQRVGPILKNGFELGGKQFEFLAYSTSALRSHAVWFMCPFRDPKEGYVNAESIRQSLGDFEGLLSTPSKYAARIAQAFTATDPSVELVEGQWEEMEDILVVDPETGVEKSNHTDGVGTISPELGEMIWKVRCEAFNFLYQIRFLGYKGVVVVDEHLTGIKMRLRPSQRKFIGHHSGTAYLEIARSFEYPNPVYLNKPVVTVLEDRGVKKETFMELQELAKKNVFTAQDSLENMCVLLKSSNLGGKFHLAFVLEQLDKLGLDLTDRDGKTVLGSAFIGRLLRYAINDSLRLMKHRARIPVPKSYQLVGVADEGQAYINEGCKPEDVYTLGEGRIFVCIQKPNEDPRYLKGMCVISRSPVIHPGDVQRAFAIGKPPPDKLCFFRNLKNVVVLPATGERSLASCLGGGDLDGDTFDIYIENPGLLPTEQVPPAEYPSVKARELPDGRQATVDDICDFIVEYINSDVLGLLADRHLTIAGTFDSRCMELATLCSRAVDYSKHGNAIDLDKEKLPRPLLKFKPDWHKAEIADPRENDYYESDRALGHLYRGIELLPLDAPLMVPTVAPSETPLSDPISLVLAPIVWRTLTTEGHDGHTVNLMDDAAANTAAAHLFNRYAREMRYIRYTHTLSDMPGLQLSEEEVVLGAILSNCTQHRWRMDRIYRMKLHSETLVKDIRSRFVRDAAEATREQLLEGLQLAWQTWAWSLANKDKDGTLSFGLVALGVVLDCLKKMEVPELCPELQLPEV